MSADNKPLQIVSPLFLKAVEKALRLGTIRGVWMADGKRMTDWKNVAESGGFQRSQPTWLNLAFTALQLAGMVVAAHLESGSGPKSQYCSTPGSAVVIAPVLRSNWR